MPEAWAFGATPDHADQLLALVLAGVKTATSSAREEYRPDGADLPCAGDLAVVLDGVGAPRVVLQVTAVETVAFEEVSPAHAAAEGEGERTLAAWRADHERFWRQHSSRGFSPGMPVVCERFRVVHADRTAPRVLREDHPEAGRLQDAGWTVASTSWRARLNLDDDAALGPYESRVHDVRERGLTVRRLAATEAELVHLLDAETAPDFPRTPGSFHEPLPADLRQRLDGGDGRAYGVLDGARLVGFTLLSRGPDGWDVDRSAVHRPWRGQGVATAAKSLSVLETFQQGTRRWSTGGASVNAASLRMNKALGFVLEPLWLALVPPAGEDSTARV